MARKGDNIRKRKDGRWEGRYISSYDSNGKAIYKSVYGSKYSDVKKEKIKKENQVTSDNNISLSKSITIESATNNFLVRIKNKVKESTYAHYEFICQKHLIPYFKGEKANKLNNEILENFVTYKLEKGSLKGKPLSPKTVNDIICVLIQILKKYCSFDIDIEKPTTKLQEVNVLTNDEYNRLKSHVIIGTDNKKLGIIISMLTGIRLGELCALKWGDINLKKEIITINKTMQRVKETSISTGKKTKIIIDEPKTQASNRVIPIPSVLIKILEKFNTDNNLYVLTGTSKYIEPRTYQRRFKIYLEKSQIKDKKFHILRHTFATLSIEKGMDIKTLSQLLGHSDVSFTLKRYVHPNLEHKKLQIEKIAIGF